jgi:NADH:ubiquinone oxidoreductase subunit 5 (subunit L)/multisubunit Na+/H+ antiporter MnhA subunit
VNDLAVHVLLFALVGAVIVVMNAFHDHAHDGPAFRSLPRRLTTFALGCLIVTALLLFAEHFLAAPG